MRRKHRHSWTEHPPQKTIYGFLVVSPDTCSGCYMVRFVERIMNKTKYRKVRDEIVLRERVRRKQLTPIQAINIFNRVYK